DPNNVWDWHWGSNRNASTYGANLLIAARFGILGSHTREEVEDQGQRYLHYMLGLNPKNMVYLTNMAAYGGEHSSFQVFHNWFSFTVGDGERGNVKYNGLPASVTEPQYPYYCDDSQTSQYGPAPGLVPGGPNLAYSGTFTIPNRKYPAYAYRDWSVACGWTGSACGSSSWEITEPANGYQGPFVLLASLLMSRN
ncbi:MAG TPA: glycoside hydrolase family 9 protein, partial [Polyangiaceae bacterium]